MDTRVAEGLRGYALYVARVEVLFDGGSMFNEVVNPRRIEVSGEDNELFSNALARSIGTVESEVEHAHVAVDFGGSAGWVFGVLKGATLAEVDHFAGDDVVQVSVSGIGGGHVPYLLDWINAGLTLAGAIEIVRQGERAIVRALYRREREAARRWLIGGSEKPPSMELRQHVKRNSWWALADVERVFGVDAGQAAKLLRATGFVEEVLSPSGWRDADE